MLFNNCSHDITFVKYVICGFLFPQDGYGFKTDGNGQYVDLGDWSNDTCFVDVKNCEQGFINFPTLKTFLISHERIKCVVDR